MAVTGNRTILITGCRRSIGGDAAIALARRGHRVIATTHTETAAEGLRRTAASDNLPLEAFKLDVTDSRDRSAILEHDIDVLINNAAVGEMIARGGGTVIFISSLAGRITVPFVASYTMTKFAISSGAETLRNELRRIDSGVHVTMVEPGGYHTGFNQEMIAKKYEWMVEGSYCAGIIDRIKSGEKRYFRLTEQASTASIVKQIVKAAEAERPRLRYTAPWWQGLGVRLLRMAGK